MKQTWCFYLKATLPNAAQLGRILVFLRGCLCLRYFSWRELNLFRCLALRERNCGITWEGNDLTKLAVPIVNCSGCTAWLGPVVVSSTRL